MANSEIEKSLVKKRGNKGKVTIFTNYIVKVQQKHANDENIVLSDQEIVYLQARLENMKQIYSEFDQVQTELEMLSDDLDGQLKERETFEDMYHGMMATAKCLITVPLVSQAPASSRNSLISDGSNSRVSSINIAPNQNTTITNTTVRSVKLPDIKLPTFTGDYNSWLEYRDTYTSLIHHRKDMDEIQNSLLEGVTGRKCFAGYKIYRILAAKLSKSL